MEDRVVRLEAAVRDLERRLAALEGSHVVEADLDGPHPLAAAATVGRSDVAHVLSFVARSFVALGGAFLLRAITDANILPHPAGIAAGLAYACVWLALAYRTGATDPMNAIFHALVSAVIAYPLVWEATVRFSVFTPSSAALAIGGVTTAAIVIAIARRIQAVAWIAVVALLVTTVALVVVTSVVMPFALLTLAAGIATLWLGYGYGWTLLRWPVAFVLNVLVIGLTMRVTKTTTEWPVTVVAVQLLLLNAYIGSIATRTLVRQRNVNVFEMLQTLAVVAVGFGGAVYVAYVTGSGIIPLAVVNLAAGSACYAIAWIFVAKREGLTRNFYYYSTLGIVLLMVSSRLLLDDVPLALVCAALAVVAVIVGQKSHLTMLRWHGIVYLLTAVIVSGAITGAYDAFLGSSTETWRTFSVAATISAVACIACWWISRRLEFVAFVIWNAGGWLVLAIVPPLCGVPGVAANAAGIATVRTLAVALACYWAARIAAARH